MMMNSYRNLINCFLSLLILIIGGVWIWISRDAGYTHSAGTATAPQTGFLAPDFTLPDLDIETITLSQFKGTPVILNFWASWCPPCRREMPAFQKLFTEYQTNELVVLGINALYRDQPDEVRKFQIQNQLTFPILVDNTGLVFNLYHIHSLPTTVFIDAEGEIQNIIIGGPLPPALLRIEAEKLLKE